MKSIMITILVFVSCAGWTQARLALNERILTIDTLYQGQPCTKEFYLKNIGSEPLIISTAKTACGCDVASWDKDPILPGDSSRITYKYDSNRIGPINKSMTIQTNDTIEPTVIVRFKGMIKPKE